MKEWHAFNAICSERLDKVYLETTKLDCFLKRLWQFLFILSHETIYIWVNKYYFAGVNNFVICIFPIVWFFETSSEPTSVMTGKYHKNTSIPYWNPSGVLWKPAYKFGFFAHKTAQNLWRRTANITFSRKQVAPSRARPADTWNE